MRLDVVTEGPAESAAELAGLVPASVVKAVWGFSMARTLVSAVELGVFKALADGPATAEAVAERLDLDPGGTETLLRALNGFGVLKRKRGAYRLGREASRYLTGEGPADMSPAVAFAALLDEKLRGLADAIRTGERPDFHETLDEAGWEAYLRGLASLAPLAGAEVARKLPLSAPRRVLDVAGGHGGFSVALCRKHPSLEADILDLPGGVRVGRQIVDETEVRERIAFREGDLREAAWGEGYDAVLLFNILHNLPEADARAAVHQAKSALAPGGLLAILEGQSAGKDGDLSFQEGFGELLFWVLSASKTWPAPTMAGWMVDAGFAPPKQKKLLSLPGAVLQYARLAR